MILERIAHGAHVFSSAFHGNVLAIVGQQFFTEFIQFARVRAEGFLRVVGSVRCNTDGADGRNDQVGVDIQNSLVDFFGSFLGHASFSLI